MNYIFQRIIKNDFGWVRPSPGRLGKYGEGEFVKKSGFGHEDWNFNDELVDEDDYIHGYTYYTPSEEKKHDKYNIAFAIYNNSKWHVVGFYKNAQYVEKSLVSRYILERKVNDLVSLGSSLGKQFNTRKRIRKEIEGSSSCLHWKVHSKNVVRLIAPFEIPKHIFDTKNYRIVNPTNLTKDQFS